MKTKTGLIIIFMLLMILPFAHASLFSSGDITFSLNQKEYYFKTGENAIIPLETENTYGKSIDGTLTDSYTEKINQGGMQFSSSNSQSITFTVADGDNTQNMDFGTSQNPEDLQVTLKFAYDDGKESRVVNLDGITIHFVSDDSQKQNTQNKQSASSEKAPSQTQQNSGQNAFSQMQNQINQMMGEDQQTQQAESTQQKLQNNQMGQDSSALKKEMQEQAQEQSQMQNEFGKNLGENPDFQKKNSELQNQGYNMTSASLNPSANDSGSFDMQYQNQNGETAELKGEMENGSVKNLQSLTQEDKNNIMQQLKQDKNFQKLNSDLEKQNFNETDSDISPGENQTNIKINYEDEKNQTAEITADYVNGTIQNVKMNSEKQNEYSGVNFWVWFFVVFVLCLVIGYFAYKKYYKTKKKNSQEPVNEIKIEKPFDYRGEARKMLDESKRMFERKNYKDAYEKAGQALRVFLSYKHHLKKETTNDEVIRFLKDAGDDTRKIKECFDLCSLVEFAKYKENKKDFDKIIEVAGKIIG